MAPDDFQQAWQSQSSQTRVTIDVDLLHEEVQREQLNFRAMIFFRDFFEVGVALTLIPIWFILGALTSSPWTWYLTVPVLIWMACIPTAAARSASMVVAMSPSTMPMRSRSLSRA